MPARYEKTTPDERDLKRLKRLLSGAIGDLEAAHRDASLMKCPPRGGKRASSAAGDADGQYDLKKIDAYVEILSRCDQLRRDLYSLPTPRDVQEMEKEKRRRRAEEQGNGSGYVILAPVEELDADCPEVDS